MCFNMPKVFKNDQNFLWICQTSSKSVFRCSTICQKSPKIIKITFQSAKLLQKMIKISIICQKSLWICQTSSKKIKNSMFNNMPKMIKISMFNNIPKNMPKIIKISMINFFKLANTKVFIFQYAKNCPNFMFNSCSNVRFYAFNNMIKEIFYRRRNLMNINTLLPQIRASSLKCSFSCFSLMCQVLANCMKCCELLMSCYEKYLECVCPNTLCDPMKELLNSCFPLNFYAILWKSSWIRVSRSIFMPLYGKVLEFVFPAQFLLLVLVCWRDKLYLMRI
jgi:hypothetical protein